jgi:hypothetical protein
MAMNNISINIGPRYMKQDRDGLRPFQREALEAVRNSEAKLIFVKKVNLYYVEIDWSFKGYRRELNKC